MKTAASASGQLTPLLSDFRWPRQGVACTFPPPRLASLNELENATWSSPGLTALGCDAGNVRRDRPTAGDSLFLWHDDRLAGVAVCHCGPGTEAGSGVCYIKFGVVLPGPAAPQHFDRLLGACEEMTAEKGLARLVAGVNTARHEAYRPDA